MRNETEATATPEPTTQQEALEVGQHVTVKIGSRANTFVVEKLEPGRVHLRVLDSPPSGKKWNMRGMGYAVPVLIGRRIYETKGGTGKVLRLSPVSSEED